MKSFLQHIVDDIPQTSLSDLKDWCFVFPSKRAGLYFEQLLNDRFKDETFWGPTIQGIEDFVIEGSGHKPGDEITLVFLLYEVYKKIQPNLEFEKFYSWGQILLSDFDEIDRNLIDAKKMYDGLASRKEIDEVFGENEELKDAYEKFLGLFTSQTNTELASRFVKNWKDVYKAYFLFEEKMTESGIFHTGRLQKDLASRDSSDAFPYKKIIFAGFNALSKSEERIIQNTLKEGLSEVYWDCDKLYMQNDSEEAGQYLRAYRKAWNYNGVHWIETDLINDPKEIWSIGCPQMVSQAKYVNKLIHENQLEASETAIILGDELLMMPVLNAIDVETINVTMGYPLKSTSIYHVVLETIRLHGASRKSKSDRLLESHRIMALLKNSLISPVFKDLSSSIATKIRKEKRKWVESKELLELCGNSWLSLVFTSPDSYETLLLNIESFLVKLYYYLKDDKKEISDETSKEIIYHGLKHLIRFRENLKAQSFNPGINFLGRLFSETFRSIRIPFSGEPLQGIQVMGFLESRALDFKNIILLGVNENKLPRTAIGNTYIPFIARKAFGLPTYDDHQAIYAYHFKRVLQRAKNIWMLHDTEVAIDGSGEKSRFILQLQNTASRDNRLTINEKSINVPYKSNSYKKELTVAKTPAIMELLNKYTDPEEKKRISPSRLVIYIDCKLRFYLQYVAKVPEKDPILEQIDARVFGNIVHRTMELIYTPYKGKELTVEIIDGLSKDIEPHIQKAMEEASVVHSSYNLHGIDVLLESVIRKLVSRIIQEDKKNLPFTIQGLEEEVEHKLMLTDGREVLLGGTVDRIDEKDGSRTIIDYKSGRVDLVSRTHSGIEDTEKYLDAYFTDGKYKSGFQTYFYMLLMKLTSDQPVKGAIYELKKLGDGKKYLRKGETMSDEMGSTYQGKLQNLIQEILDPSVPFDQTENLTKCSYCPYTTICER